MHHSMQPCGPVLPGPLGLDREPSRGAADTFHSCFAAAGQLRNMREKHRSAQRRYRARLRAKHEEADQRVEQLTRELNELKAAQVGSRFRTYRVLLPLCRSAWLNR